MLLLSLTLLLMPFDLAPFFDAYQQSRWDAIFRVAARAVSVGILGLFIWTQKTLTLPVVAFTSLVFLAINASLAWPGARWLGLTLQPRLVVSEMRSMFTLALPIFWAQAMSQIYIHTNLVLLGFFSTDRETGYYAVADRILMAILTLKGIIYRLLIPLLSEVAHDHDRLIKRLELVIPLLAQVTVPIAVISILVADPVLPMVFGKAYSPAVWPFRILAAYIVFTGFGSIFGTALFATGHQRQYSLSITVGSVANLLLCFVLIPLLGAIGAAVSSAAAEIVVLVVSFLYFRRGFRPVVFRSIVHALIAGAAMAAVYCVTPLNGDYAFAGKSLVGGGVFIVVLWIFGELNSAKMGMLRQLFRLSRD
jgi:O-antigen/teichoic acid export membrane protein